MEKLTDKGNNSFSYDFIESVHIPECVAMVADVFKLERDTVSDWFLKRLVNNPYQSRINGLGIGIWKASELIGFRAMVAQPWWLEGKRTFIAFASHTCVKKEYRGKGLGVQLIMNSHKCASLRGSTSAGVSTQPIYLKSGYRSFGGDNCFFRTRVSYKKSFIKRLGPSLGSGIGSVSDLLLIRKTIDKKLSETFSFALLDRCGEEFDRLWERARKGYASCLERSREYLNWRLFDQPTCPLHLGGLFDKNGKLRAFAVWHVFAFDGYIGMVVLRDFFAVKEDNEAFISLLKLLLEHWRRDGIAWASFEVAHPRITDMFRSLGFEHVPSKGDRYFIHAEDAVAESTWNDWFRSGLDGDYSDIKDSRIS